MRALLARNAAAAEAVEHCGITRYGSLIAWAKLLRRNDCAQVLRKHGAKEPEETKTCYSS